MVARAWVLIFFTAPNSDILSSGFLRTLFLYPDPNRASQAYGAVEAYEHTDSKRNGEGEYRGRTHEGAHDRTAENNDLALLHELLE